MRAYAIYFLIAIPILFYIATKEFYFYYNIELILYILPYGLYFFLKNVANDERKQPLYPVGYYIGGGLFVLLFLGVILYEIYGMAHLNVSRYGLYALLKPSILIPLPFLLSKLNREIVIEERKKQIHLFLIPLWIVIPLILTAQIFFTLDDLGMNLFIIATITAVISAILPLAILQSFAKEPVELNIKKFRIHQIIAIIIGVGHYLFIRVFFIFMLWDRGYGEFGHYKIDTELIIIFHSFLILPIIFFFLWISARKKQTRATLAIYASVLGHFSLFIILSDVFLFMRL